MTRTIDRRSALERACTRVMRAAACAAGSCALVAAQNSGTIASQNAGTPAEPPSRTMLRELTSAPRLAGTVGSLWSAKLVARWLADAGWKVEIDDRAVMLSLPRNIELTAYANAFDDTPIIAHIDRFDPDAIPPGDLPKCNGWSASGDVRGLVVDAGYGLRADFERLKSLGVDARGAIALVRYGRSYRGIKVDLATQYGCSGVLLFDDPAEDGPERGKTWPEGPWKPDWDAQRGSISPMAHIPGDPSTPGWASGKPGDESVKRVDKKELDLALPRIPCVPIGARDARTLQAKLSSVSTKDKDGKASSERLGPGPVQVHLVVDQPRDMRVIHNVIAKLPGQSDACVIAGAHRDAWVRGANDDGAGTVLMLRAAQHLGAKARAGWKPKSTIYICLWDAEEFGMIGSTEWGEAHAGELEQNAIAYVNADTGVSGPHFRGASGTPGLLGTLKDVLQRVACAPQVAPPSTNASGATSGATSSPSANGAASAPAAASANAATSDSTAQAAPAPKTLWDEWLATVRARSKDEHAEPHLGLPGSGSDFAVFLHHLSIPVLQFGFGDSESGQYHTTFDDFAVVDRYIDPGFVGHEIAGTFAAELLAELSERGSAAFRVDEAADELARRAREAADEIAPEPNPATGGEDVDAPGAASSVRDPAPQQLADALRRVSDELHGLADAARQASASGAARDSVKRASAFYAEFALRDGLPGREWYRNPLWTPGLEDGYGSETFPTLRSASKESATALERATQSLIQSVARVRAALASR
jgi:N-acetylated-alpha-linked acidic dipeptidase